MQNKIGIQEFELRRFDVDFYTASVCGTKDNRDQKIYAMRARILNV